MSTICPWCSGTGCGSCQGSGERPETVVVHWTCEAKLCDLPPDFEGGPCPVCGNETEQVETEIHDDDDFDPPDDDGWIEEDDE